MKIQLKRSNQLQDYGNGNEAKRPTAAQMEYGELAVNYNTADPAIFMEDSDGNIVRIAGKGYDYNDLNNLPVIGDANFVVKNSEGTTLSTFSANATADVELNLPAGTTDTNTTYTITSVDNADADASTLRLLSGGDGAGVEDDILLQGAGGLTITQTGGNQFTFTQTEGALYTAEDGKGIAINASNEISIGDDWSNIPSLP